MSHETIPGKDRRVYDVLVLGAGASGLMCARTTVLRGRSVLLIDHGDAPGRKLAVTGGGKCNLTNQHVSAKDYVGENPDFCRSALARFTPQDMLNLMAAAGIALEEREHGQMFCRRSAKDVLNFFRASCLEAGCKMALGRRITGLYPAEQAHGPPGAPGREFAETPLPVGARFCAQTSQGPLFGRNAVIALGSPAWPQVGATGTGYELARAFGHRIVTPVPALAGLIMPEDWLLAGLSGIAVPARIKVLFPKNTEQDGGSVKNKNSRKRAAENTPAADNFSLLFTHKGISGPAALQASLHWRRGLRLEVDFLPGLPLESLLNTPGAGKLLLRNLIRRHLPDRLVEALARSVFAEHGSAADLFSKKAAELNRAQRDTLALALHRHTVLPVSTEGFAKAEAAAGGVDCADVSSRTMESKLMPGLYFCGEILDVTGRLGGYNLHWAFASGHAAGESL